MGNFVLMPKLGMTMTDGKIIKWLVNEGEKVEKGDYIFEVETDKTSLEVDSLYSGILLKQYYEAGQDVPCNFEIGYIGEEGEEIPALPKHEESAAAPEEKTPAPVGAACEEEESSKETVAAPLSADDEKKYDYDLAIIGAGPGGYVAALRAAQLGAKVAVVEKDELGGTCLNRGCIPTKALYSSAKKWKEIQHADENGFAVTGATFDFAKVMANKDKAVKRLTGGVGMLLKKSKVDVFKGMASMEKEHEVVVGEKTITCRFAMLATGSTPASVLKNVGKGVEIYDTDKLMGLKKLPDSVVIVGGGIIGCEIGCIMNSFGVKVTIVELLPTILPMVDVEVAELLASHMKKEGIEILNGITVDAVEKSGKSYSVKLKGGKEISCGMVIEAVGRKVCTDSFEKLGVQKSEKGFVVADAFSCTNLASVYAIGDVTGKCQLAHAASEQGVTAVERMFGGKTVAEEQEIPSCIFTDLEIAYIGLTEAEAKEKGLAVRTFKFPFSANGKAITLGETEGFVKVVADERFGEILGVHIIGPEASTMIHEAAQAMRLEATAEFAGSTVHAHPTLSEALMEAFLGCSKGAIHL
jgi:dihydrolipoamide dehydrogenase